jgi:5-methylcytosine-specific restriction endonuclease McrA
MTLRDCKVCKQSFDPTVTANGPTYCSHACYTRERRRKKNPEHFTDKPCAICAQLFTPQRGLISKCCSVHCQDKLTELRKKQKYEDNKAHLHAYRAQWAKNNRAKQNAYASISRSKKPDHYAEAKRTNQNRRRFKLIDSGGFHTQEQWIWLVAQTGNKCLCCKEPGTFRTLTKDHIVPVFLGGSDDIDNIQPLCKSCNSSKQTKIIDFREVAA